MLIRYLSHPQVLMDPDVDVPDWGLNEVGLGRVMNTLGASWQQGVCFIMSSAERKAVETADPIAKHLGIALQVNERMHENDRSATGFLPPEEFEAVATEFFSHPEVSVRGWERAVDAQGRIVREVEQTVETVLRSGAGRGDVLFVGHGGVGTLLYCHFAGRPIARQCDQAGGGGNYFTIDWERQLALHPWIPMEEEFE